MSVVALRPAPTCSRCHERPASYLVTTEAHDPASDVPLLARADVATFACDTCAASSRDEQGRTSAGTGVARLPAGVLLTLARAQPRCRVLVCTAPVAAWGDSCDGCRERGERAVNDAVARVRRERRKARASK